MRRKPLGDVVLLHHLSERDMTGTEGWRAKPDNARMDPGGGCLFHNKPD